MKYIVIRTSISIEGGLPIFTSHETELLNDQRSAINKAMRMYREDIDEMESMTCLESSCYQRVVDDETFVDARICCKSSAVIITVKAIEKSEERDDKNN